MKHNTTWPLLVKKAEDRVTQRLKDHQACVENEQKLQGSRQRILDMIEGYKAKLNQRQQQPLSIAETTNFREFMSQLLRLVERVDDDLRRAHQARELAKQRLLEAEIALFKMQAMVEKDVRAVAAHHKKQEQRQMDALGITQFNLKSASSPVPASDNTVA